MIELLKVQVGSKAHGLATAESDDDSRGVFTYPTKRFWTLDENAYPDSWRGFKPDCTLLEVRRFLKHALGGDPAWLEVLFAEPVLNADEHGLMLRENRHRFVSLEAVTRLQHASHSILNKPVIKAKNLRHSIRVMRAASELVNYGTWTVKVQRPEELRDIGERTVAEVLELWRTEETQLNMDIALNRLSLPERGDWQWASWFLSEVRGAHLPLTPNMPLEVLMKENDQHLRRVLESCAVVKGVSLESSVEPGQPARNYELALRLGIGHVFGLKEDADA